MNIREIKMRCGKDGPNETYPDVSEGGEVRSFHFGGQPIVQAGEEGKEKSDLVSHCRARRENNR